MKTFSLVLSLVLSSAAFADGGGCQIGIDAKNLSDAQTAVVRSMAKQLQDAGCSVGDASPSTTNYATPAPGTSSSSVGGCSNGMTETVYGCVATSGVCNVPGTNVSGVLYNGTCVAAEHSNDSYNTNTTCQSGLVLYMGQCYVVPPIHN